MSAAGVCGHSRNAATGRRRGRSGSWLAGQVHDGAGDRELRTDERGEVGFRGERFEVGARHCLGGDR